MIFPNWPKNIKRVMNVGLPQYGERQIIRKKEEGNTKKSAKREAENIDYHQVSPKNETKQ